LQRHDLAVRIDVVPNPDRRTEMPARPVASPLAPLAGIVRRVIDSPRFQMAMGMAVFLIGLAELVEEAFALVLPAPDTHHGLLVLGAVIALRGLVDVIEGAEHVAVAGVRDDMAEPAARERRP
jgi:hypothetical protein